MVSWRVKNYLNRFETLCLWTLLTRILFVSEIILLIIWTILMLSKMFISFYIKISSIGFIYLCTYTYEYMYICIYIICASDQFSSVAQLCLTLRDPWITARHASLSITNSRSSLKLMSIESVMPSRHLILCRPLLLPPIPSQHQGIFQWVNYSHEVAKVLEFQLQHQSFQWTPRTDLL